MSIPQPTTNRTKKTTSFLLGWASLIVFLISLSACSKNCGDDPCSDPECHVECCGSTDCCSVDACGFPELCPQQCCRVDPCGNPDLCPGACPPAEGTLDSNRVAFTEPSGWDTELTPDGGTTYRGSGELVINTGCGDPLRLPLLSGEVNFGPDGIFRSLTGELSAETEACLPGATLVTQAASIRIDLFWQTGLTIAENYDLGFEINPNNNFFVFGFRSDATYGFCNPLNGTILEQPRFDVNIGQVLQLLDPCDPMTYTDVGLIGVGRQAQGRSSNGQLKFVPKLPQLGEVENIDGQSIRYGSFTYKEIIEIEGMLIRSVPWSIDLNETEILASDFEVGYEAGINGTGSLPLGLFSIPVAE
ncbi:MAG: hypothetical protein AAF597_15805, partial [Bacteroidota bacterium]